MKLEDAIATFRKVHDESGDQLDVVQTLPTLLDSDDPIAYALVYDFLRANQGTESYPGTKDNLYNGLGLRRLNFANDLLAEEVRNGATYNLRCAALEAYVQTDEGSAVALAKELLTDNKGMRGRAHDVIADLDPDAESILRKEFEDIDSIELQIASFKEMDEGPLYHPKINVVSGLALYLYQLTDDNRYLSFHEEAQCLVSEALDNEGTPKAKIAYDTFIELHARLISGLRENPTHPM